MVNEKTVAAHQERVSPLLNKILKPRLDLDWATCIHEQQPYPKSTRCSLHLSRFGLRINGISRVAKVGDRRGRRHQLEEHFKALCDHFGQGEVEAGEISARSPETADKADLDRVGALHEDDRDCLGRRLGCKRTMCALQDNDHGYLAANQFCDQRRQPIVLTLCPPVFDRHVPALGVTGLTQASLKSGKILARRLERCEVEKPDYRHRRLLRPRRERPSGRAAEQRDELPPSHVGHGGLVPYLKPTPDTRRPWRCAVGLPLT